MNFSTHKAKTGHMGRFCGVDEPTVYFALRRLAAAPTTAQDLQAMARTMLAERLAGIPADLLLPFKAA